MHRLALLLAFVAPPVMAADTLVACTARWCGPCKRFHADLEADPGMAGGRNLRIVDVDDDKDEAQRLGVKSMPTFILLHDDGHELRRTTGYMGPQALKAWMDGGRH